MKRIFAFLLAMVLLVGCVPMTSAYAADDGDFSLDNDPWQLIHVFDGDTTTNVVCEGCSKAFVYTCAT